MTIRVRNVYPFCAEDRERLATVSGELDIVHGGEDTQAWADALDDPDVEVLSASYAPRATPRLRWLATAGAGIDDLLAADPWARGVVVTNGSGTHAVAMAEYVVAAALTVSERMPERLANQAARCWDTGLAGKGLRGRTAAIVGYGSVGRETARLLAALGMRVLAVKLTPSVLVDEGWRLAGTGDPDGTIPERIAGVDALHGMLGEADLVVVTLPLTGATRGLLDRAALAALRPSAVLVNVGRGPVLDEDALLAAAREGRIERAFLDVVAEEPLPPDHPFWAEDRIVVTPHISGHGDLDAYWHGVADLLAENLRRYVAGEALLNVTDPAAGY